MASAIPNSRANFVLRDAALSVTFRGSRRKFPVLSRAMFRRALVVLVMAACGSSTKGTPDAGSVDAPPTARYAVGGMVSGLVGDGLVLAINGGDSLAIAQNGTFSFTTPVANHAPYHITMTAQPVGASCVLTGGDGVIQGADVTSVEVTCDGLAIDLASDGATACSIRTDGTLWCWGQFVGATNALIPQQIGSDTDWASLVGPFAALKADRTLWGWREDFPPASDGPDAWVQVSIDWWSHQRCGIHSDGTLWCAGAPDAGQHGVGHSWLQVSRSNSEDCAIRSDNTLWCEGDNSWGELGVGDTATHTGLVQVGNATWKSVSAGMNHKVCAIRMDDTLWCWGDNSQHDIDDTATQEVTAPELRASGAWKSVTFGLLDQCAVAVDDTGWCWGNNSNGMLGVGDMDPHDGLVQIASSKSWKNVQAGNGATCGLATDGTVWCWGLSQEGAFGDGDGSVHVRTAPGIVP